MLFIYSVDEAMFFALRLLMINRSKANIGEVLNIPFAFAHVHARIMEARQYYKLCGSALCLLYLCS